METADFLTLGVGIAILALLWNLRRDVAHLRQRMADLEARMTRLETLVEPATR